MRTAYLVLVQWESEDGGREGRIQTTSEENLTNISGKPEWTTILSSAVGETFEKACKKLCDGLDEVHHVKYKLSKNPDFY